VSGSPRSTLKVRESERASERSLWMRGVTGGTQVCALRALAALDCSDSIIFIFFFFFSFGIFAWWTRTAGGQLPTPHIWYQGETNIFLDDGKCVPVVLFGEEDG
jgi:hypothetical protein